MLVGFMSPVHVARIAGADSVSCCTVMAVSEIVVLVQPTNHLDLDTIEALIAALTAYEGAIVAVSHDVFFVEKVASRESVYTVGGKKATLKGIPGI